jgi:hypothetical protein
MKNQPPVERSLNPTGVSEESKAAEQPVESIDIHGLEQHMVEGGA